MFLLTINLQKQDSNFSNYTKHASKTENSQEDKLFQLIFVKQILKTLFSNPRLVLFSVI
jgi:hypothetical protein